MDRPTSRKRLNNQRRHVKHDLLSTVFTEYNSVFFVVFFRNALIIHCFTSACTVASASVVSVCRPLTIIVTLSNFVLSSAEEPGTKTTSQNNRRLSRLMLMLDASVGTT